MSLKGLSVVTVHYIDPTQTRGANLCFDVRLRNQWRLHFVFDDGTLSIEEPSDRRVDVHISADPEVFMLVGYGRVGQWRAALKGQIVAWGRKPWLALKFGSLIRNP